MCGIFFSASLKDAPLNGTIHAKLKEVNAQRGPDAQRAIAVDSAIDTNGSLRLDFFSSELKLRGTHPVVQPHHSENHILCWNGEVFDGLEISPDENDGQILFDRLCKVRVEEELIATLGRVEGPYAFVFFDLASRRLYFGRDPLGRRSLLIHRPTISAPYFLLASSSFGPSPSYEFEDLSTEYIYKLDISSLEGGQPIHAKFGPSMHAIPRDVVPQEYPLYTKPQRVNQTLPPLDYTAPDLSGSIPDYLADAADELIAQLGRSTMLRVRDIPNVDRPSTVGSARVAILFSGGIDCAIIAALAHRYIPLEEPIDLLNVAFENPWKLKNEAERERQTTEKAQRSMYIVPDRVTGLSEVEELRRVCPGRQWNFVEVNVPYQESIEFKQLLEGLIYPSNTVMDLSLAMALYFASRGRGQVKPKPDAEPELHTSHARVVLSGLGSDELLGGYSRHRNAFKEGWKALIDELQLDIDRIPLRNLGRDDRVISSHGKETRHPFLSLSVVNYLASLPVHYKLDPRLDTGIGDKMLLRLASRKLGLVEASSRKKKAMQFGSRSARMNGEKRGDVALE